MAKTCGICSHSEREFIDVQLVNGTPLRRVAEQYGTSATALHRHKSDHLPAALVKGKDAEEVAHGDSLLDQVRGLQGKALDILLRAEAAGDLRTALGAIREARANLELLAKILGLMNVRAEVEIKPVVTWFQIGKGYIDEPSPDPSGADGVGVVDVDGGEELRQ